METNYTGHVVQAISTQIPNTAKWNLKIVVSWMDGSINEFRRFDGPVEGFGAQQEAEIWG